nr:immunoglobulin heavy chain junction region [Macaca mulatta]MOX94785.1 immunoglobulin heavy chain junction region [Macaca mulatta]MOX95915.1 immunoglobulin heavy chain junction region [Macaca mulatta]
CARAVYDRGYKPRTVPSHWYFDIW